MTSVTRIAATGARAAKCPSTTDQTIWISPPFPPHSPRRCPKVRPSKNIQKTSLSMAGTNLLSSSLSLCLLHGNKVEMFNRVWGLIVGFHWLTFNSQYFPHWDHSSAPLNCSWATASVHIRAWRVESGVQSKRNRGSDVPRIRAWPVLPPVLRQRSWSGKGMGDYFLGNRLL